jgi:Fic family protein
MTRTISQIKKKLKTLNLEQDWELVLEPWLRTELTYTSNSIEGNTLSLIETSIVINDKLGIAGKNIREIHEATNHSNAWDYMIQDLKKLRTSQLTEKHLLELHSLILKNIDDHNAGKYRNVAVRIAGSMSIFPNPLKVSEQMTNIFEWLSITKTRNIEEILQASIQTHLKIVKIHPFSDGNGRIIRLFMNTILIQNGLPPINVLPTNRQKYLEALENSTPETPIQFLDFMLAQYSDNLDQYIQTFSA